MKVIRLPKDKDVTFDELRQIIHASGVGWYDWEKQIVIKSGIVVVYCSERPGQDTKDRVASPGSYIIRNEFGGLDIAHSIIS